MARFVCSGCNYIYDEQKGDCYEGYPPGTKFSDLPEEYMCPDCSVCGKSDFVAEEDFDEPL